MAGRFVPPRLVALDSVGAPISGAKLYFYTTGTTTPLATYSDEALASANTNPVVADSAGRFGSIFLQDQDYKVVYTDGSGSSVDTDVQIWTEDPVRGSGFVTTSFLQDPTTTRGDIIARGAAALGRVALGADNTILTSDGTDVGYETLTSLLDSVIGNTSKTVIQRGASAWSGYVASGSVIQVIHKDIAEASNTTTTPAIDTSVPLVSEGVELVSQAITLKDTSSRVKISLNFFISGTTALSQVFAVFRGSTCIGATIHQIRTSGSFHTVSMQYLDSPASASELTYSVRWGTSGSTAYVNLNGGSSVFGGAANIANGLILEEIAS